MQTITETWILEWGFEILSTKQVNNTLCQSQVSWYIFLHQRLHFSLLPPLFAPFLGVDRSTQHHSVLQQVPKGITSTEGV